MPHKCVLYVKYDIRFQMLFNYLNYEFLTFIFPLITQFLNTPFDEKQPYNDVKWYV